MIEEWTINLGIAITGAVATYAVLRNRVDRLEKDFAQYSNNSTLNNSDLDRKLSAQFNRVDTTIERVVVLEQNTATHLNMERAEEKFVSKKELELHFKNIEIIAKNTSSKMDDTNRRVEKMEGKLGELVELLSTCSLKAK